MLIAERIEMYCILIELRNLRQMLRIRRDEAESILLALERITQQASFMDRGHESGVLAFESDSRNERRLAEAVEATRRLLEDSRRVFAGYQVLIEQFPDNDWESAVSNARRGLRRLPTTDGVFLGPRATVALARSFHTTSADGHVRVEGPSRIDADTPEGIVALYQRDRVVAEILDRIEPAINGPGTTTWLHLVGPPDLGGVALSIRVARELGVPQNDILHLRPGCGRAFGAFATPLRRQMSGALWGTLRFCERDLWRMLTPGLLASDERTPAAVTATAGRRVVASAFRLVAAAMRRRAIDQSVPVVIIADRLSEWSEWETALLRSLESPPAPQTLIVTADRLAADPGLMATEPISYAIPPLSLQDARDYNPASLPNGAVAYPPTTAGISPGTWYFHLLSAVDAAKEPASAAEAMVAYCRGATAEWVAAYTIALLPVAMPREHVEAILRRLGQSQPRIPEVLRHLLHNGIIEDLERPSLVLPEIAALLQDGDSERALQVRREVGRYLRASIDSGTLAPSIDVLRSVERCLGVVDAAEVAAGLLRTTIAQGSVAAVERILSEIARFEDIRGDRAGRYLVDVSLRMGALVMQTWAGSTEGAEQAHAELVRTIERQDPGRRMPAINLLRARHRSAIGDTKTAGTLAKHAIIRAQDDGNSLELAAAHEQLAAILLAERHGTAAAEHYSIAWDHSRGCRWVGIDMRIRYQMLVVDFLNGALSRSIEGADQLATDATRRDAMEVHVAAAFLAARVDFEVGRYETADERLQRLLAAVRTYGMVDAEAMVRRWLARVKTYRGNPSACLRALATTPSNPERVLFAAEALCESGRERESLAELRRAAVRTPAIYSFELFHRNDGFADIEDRAIGRDGSPGVLWYQIEALRAYLTAKVEDRAEGIQALRSLTRSIGADSLDPNARLYLYWYSETLGDARDGTTDDRTTVLSKSVRHMQRFVASIERHTDKVSYIESNLWNRRLVGEARRRNLL